ncbi:hypothetical protein OC842_004351 [Tilletia horrida]|uniref:Transcription initiation factor TFIID subunit 1 histone acetyltransferase domain-containing protein n=1 Tax=Tilletia horrida TaxID=155126 RepID=A0AAN6GBW9_9BASI|nr:hypothetical protein OC842_004351 [Tilletia horrida]KAK0559628.1 hypothetical protein OC844_004281 [Tilletia horrida]
MEDGAVRELDSLALGNVLAELGIDDGRDSRGLRQMGLASDRNLDRDQIYNDKYADDDDAAQGGGKGRFGNDYEREVDEELEQDAIAGHGKDLERYFRKGLEAMESSRFQVRGEVDYDDEEEELLGKKARQPPASQLKQAQAVPASEAPPSGRPQSSLQLVKAERAAAKVEAEVKSVHTLWPQFRKDAVLNFTDLFFEPPLKRRKTAAPKPKFRIVPESSLPYPLSTRELAHQTAWTGTSRQHFVRSLVANSFPPEAYEEDWTDDEEEAVMNHGPGVKAVELDDWEDAIQWDVQTAPGPPRPMVDSTLTRPLNHDIEGGAWTKSILWDIDGPSKEMPIMLDMNDPDLILQEHFPESDAPGPSAKMVAAPVMSHRTGRAPVELDPFNLSNDRFYEVSREQRQRVRQTLGQLEVQHAWPAVKLQFPFYKTRLSKGEARSFHRPAMQFPLNVPIKFSKVRSAKKKKDLATKGRTAAGRNKEKDVWETLKKPRDLTLKDTSNFVLYEYSEEYPAVLSNLGMGSLLVNYYRKKSPKDEHIPKAELGVPFILDVTDESPYMKFGSVKPGQTQPTLYNNLIRAPLFKHKPAHTDFLLVRSTNKKEVKYVLREIKHLYTVGQIFPVVLIPGPHARLVSNVIKWRMQMIAFKLVQASPLERLKIAQIMKYFPDQNELQMRQRLKDIMEYNRRAGDPNQGFWKLKSGVVIPSDLDMYKPLPPEHVCLCEAMQAGQRYLLDLGYTKSAEGADDDAADESKMDIEQLLAPWLTSKNFLNAATNKAMLKLHGDGDPTGRGEGFSLLRVSMKEVFVRAGEVQPAEPVLKKGGQRYNVAEQQAIYRSEIERIWNAQRKALSNPVPATITAEDIRRLQMQAKQQPSQMKPTGFRNDPGTPLASARATPDLESGSQAGGDANKVLKIRRLINGKWKTEIVRDPNVWHAYVRQRQKIEDENTATEALVPTGDEAIDANRRKRLEEELASRIRNQERRLQRKNMTLAGVLPGRGEAKVRKCGKCGQMGHMSTNTACPMHPKHHKNRQAEAPASTPGTPLSATATSMWPTSGPPSASFFPPTMPSPLGPVPPTPMYAPYAGAGAAGVPSTPGLPPGTPGLRIPMPPPPGSAGFPGLQRPTPGAMSPPPVPLVSGSASAGPSTPAATATTGPSAPKLKLKLNRPRPSDS